jgi:hypothetical protein
MAGAIVFWLVAAVGGYFVWGAQRSGEMLRFARGRFSPEQPIERPLITREDEPKTFHDALVIRWAGVGLFVIAGATCAIAEWIGISN